MSKFCKVGHLRLDALETGGDGNFRSCIIIKNNYSWYREENFTYYLWSGLKCKNHFLNDKMCPFHKGQKRFATFFTHEQERQLKTWSTLYDQRRYALAFVNELEVGIIGVTENVEKVNPSCKRCRYREREIIITTA